MAEPHIPSKIASVDRTLHPSPLSQSIYVVAPLKINGCWQFSDGGTLYGSINGGRYLDLVSYRNSMPSGRFALSWRLSATGLSRRGMRSTRALPYPSCIDQKR